ncbi:sensor histidine kinase [Propioniciclava coleopterorum]|uniref:histidine kinase n=1 Tax=Propioniciclava coleopterorum TaxID=2714937 RepID=A0A6G7YA94_9ACTN|nr:sensor histidine kinase [Propioniciclava coleopterorum]
MARAPVVGWTQLHPGRLGRVFGRRKQAAPPAGAQADYARAVQQLTESRRTIVDAFEIERARIERDLHDGAQQYLVAASMKVGEALLALEGLRSAADSPQLVAVARLLAEAQDDTDGALKALRETVAGVHSRTLAERGLEAAVRELGERLSTPESAIEVRVPHPLPPLPPGVLSAAWFFASEALTNAIKHAPGSHVSVVVAADTTLHVSVVDDGPGGAALRPGHGLAGLRERLATFGGELSLTSPPGGPTSVAARIPLLLRRGETGVPTEGEGRP